MQIFADLDQQKGEDNEKWFKVKFLLIKLFNLDSAIPDFANKVDFNFWLVFPILFYNKIINFGKARILFSAATGFRSSYVCNIII